MDKMHKLLTSLTTSYPERCAQCGTVYKHPLQSYINIVYTF